MIDLHSHSTFSDGTLSPSELIYLAKETGVNAIALTDHDTISGLKIAKETADKIGVELINGIEISAYYNETELHILGLFLDLNNETLLKELKVLEETREKRNIQLVENLKTLNFDISYDYVKSTAVSNLITKAHFARALLEKGYISSIQEGFDIYLGENKLADVKRELPDFKKAIEIINKSGGKSILAHPYSYGLSEEDIEEVVKNLKNAGLQGIECYYSTHTKEQEEFLLNLATKYSLKISGGSDFHGDNRPNTFLGKGKGNLNISYEILKNLKEV